MLVSVNTFLSFSKQTLETHQVAYFIYYSGREVPNFGFGSVLLVFAQYIVCLEELIVR